MTANVTHIEVSEQNTQIVSYEGCSLGKTPQDKKQLFNGNICCKIIGQGQDYVCPNFYGVVHNNGITTIDCRKE